MRVCVLVFVCMHVWVDGRVCAHACMHVWMDARVCLCVCMRNFVLFGFVDSSFCVSNIHVNNYVQVLFIYTVFCVDNCCPAIDQKEILQLFSPYLYLISFCLCVCGLFLVWGGGVDEAEVDFRNVFAI